MKYLCLILLFPFIFSCGPSQTDKESEPDTGVEIPEPAPLVWKTYAKNEYSISYPSSWNFTDTTKRMAFVILSPFDQMGDIFRENITLTIDTFGPGEINLDGYVAGFSQHLLTMPVKILSSERVGKGDSAYHQIILSGKQGNSDLKMKQICRVKNDRAYLLTLSAEATKYYAVLPVADQILNSFVIKPLN